MSAHPASNPAPGVKFVLGIAKKAGKSVSQVQSVIFDKLKWSKDTAKKWLREQGFTSTTPESAATYWRFRQKSPAKYKRFATIEPGARNPDERGAYAFVGGVRVGLGHGGQILWASDWEKLHRMAREGHTQLERKSYGPSTYGDVSLFYLGEANRVSGGRGNPLTLQNLHLIEHHAKDAASSYRGKRAPSSSVMDKGFREAMKHLKSELGKVTAADRKQYRGVYFRAFRSAVKLGGERGNPWSPESGEPWPGLRGKGRFGIVNTLTLVRIPYRFETREEAQKWIDSYQVSGEYKSNYRIVEGNPSYAYSVPVYSVRHSLPGHDLSNFNEAVVSRAGLFHDPGSALQLAQKMHDEGNSLVGVLSGFYNGRRVYIVHLDAYRAAQQLGAMGVPVKMEETVRTHNPTSSNPMTSPVVAEIYRQLISQGINRRLSFVQWDENTLKVSRGEDGSLIKYNAATDLYDVTEYHGFDRLPEVRGIYAEQLLDVIMPSFTPREGYGSERRNPLAESLAGGLAAGAAAGAAAGYVGSRMRNPMPLRSVLVHTVTEYDRKQEGKKGYNRYAVGHYLKAVGHVMEEVDKGYSVRSAITNNFTGPLANYLLRTVGESGLTRDEQIGSPIREERNPERNGFDDPTPSGWGRTLGRAYAGDVISGNLPEQVAAADATISKQRLYDLAKEYFDENREKWGFNEGHLTGFSVAFEHGYNERMSKHLGHHIRRNPTTTLPDGRVFPTYNGETLSWSIGLYMTPNEERTGYPRARAVISAMKEHRPDQLEKERREMLKASFNRMFGHNAKKELDLIESETGTRSNPADLSQAAFDAAKDFRLSGAYSETGVANARVAKYGFSKWYNSHTKQELRGKRKSSLLKAWMEGWVAGKRIEKKGNPESSASDLSASFHGRDPEEITEYVDEVHEHEWYTGLGDLVELKVRTLTDLDATIQFEEGEDRPKLCSSEDGRQLYIIGGDHSLDLAALKMSGEKWEKDLMTIGVLYELTYRTEKGFDSFKLTDYFHDLGEESGVQPMLLYDARNQSLSVAGGQYQVKKEGIVN